MRGQGMREHGQYRYRWSCQILYGHYTDFMDLQGRKSTIAQERGWVPATFWVATAGGLNDFFLEREYADLEHFAKELEARDADFEFMKAMRESYTHVVQGSVKIELFQAAIPPED
jgi:hypothetical protein